MTRTAAKDRWLTTLVRTAHRAVAAASMVALAACGPRLVEPATLVAPYDGTRLVAVAPPLNESGVSNVDTVRIAELATGELEQVVGLRTISTTRVLLAMREIGVAHVATRNEAIALMNALGADGLVVGTVSAWDPYPPQTIGMAVELFLRDAPTGAAVDPNELRMSVGDRGGTASRRSGQPVAQASGYFDASNHAVLQALALYSTGRAEPESAFGQDIYLYSMDAYTRFVAHELVADLLASEQRRIQTEAAAAAAAATAAGRPSDGKAARP